MRVWATLPFALTGALFVIQASGCGTTSEDDPSVAPRFLRFAFDATDNAALGATVEGAIRESEIDLFVPEEVDATALVASFEVTGGEVFVGEAPQSSGLTPNDFRAPVVYELRGERGDARRYIVRVRFGEEPRTTEEEPEHVLPHFYIETDGQAQIESKKTYVPGSLRIDGGDEYEDFTGSMKIRGRGNSTWEQPKKPYRIKLEEKASVLGLPAEKNWVLLANYLDSSLMGNAIAMKAGQLLELPFTHHMIPVDVTFNGEYLGNYMLTEHKEVTPNRINIGADGVLLELDQNFDEDYQFRSAGYTLPVMVQHPDLGDLPAEEADVAFGAIRSEFEALESLLVQPSFPDNGYRDLLDGRSFAKYVLVYYLSANGELNHPKSVYLYKLPGEPYRMGPIWDFDWAWGYNGTAGSQFSEAREALFWTGEQVRSGTRLFTRVLEDPQVRALVREEWAAFRQNALPGLLGYIDGYAKKIRTSYARDYERWGQGAPKLDAAELSRVITWMNARASYIDEVVSGW